LVEVADFPKLVANEALIDAILEFGKRLVVASPVLSASKIVSAASMPLFIAK